MSIEFVAADSEYIDCGSAASIDDLATRSVAFWLYLDLDADGALVQKVDSGPAFNGWSIEYKTGNPWDDAIRLYEDWDNGGNSGDWDSGAASFSTGAWTHVAVTYDSGATANNPIFYINGSVSGPVENNTPANAHDSDAGFTLKAFGNVAGYSDGKMEDLRVGNVIWTPEQIAQLAAGYRGPLGGEVLWLDAEGVEAAAVVTTVDKTTNKNHGTPQNGPTYRASQAPRYG